MDAASLLSFSVQAAATGEALWPAVVRFASGGEEYPAAVTEPRVLGQLVDGGENEQGELVVRIRKQVHPVKPAVNVMLEWRQATETAFRAVKWYVSEVTGNEVDAVWLVRCLPKN